MKILIAAFVLAFFQGCLVGCSQNHAENVDSWREAVRNAQELGVEGDFHVVQGDGHFMGQAFNFLGMHWDAYIRVRPAPASQPVSP